MVSMKPIGLREIIENAKIATMKRERQNATGLLPFGQIWIWIAMPVFKQRLAGLKTEMSK
jgi:hypothetical protein